MGLKVDDLKGSWTLEDFILEKDGFPRPWREGAHGILIYSPDGYMSVSINSKSREHSWIDSLLFYAGTYEVDGDTVTHQVLNATGEKRIDKAMVRKGQLNGNILELVTEGSFGKATLRWEKHHSTTFHWSAFHQFHKCGGPG